MEKRGNREKVKTEQRNIEKENVRKREETRGETEKTGKQEKEKTRNRET